jgi:hypothetical protein
MLIPVYCYILHRFYLFGSSLHPSCILPLSVSSLHPLYIFVVFDFVTPHSCILIPISYGILRVFCYFWFVTSSFVHFVFLSFITPSFVHFAVLDFATLSFMYILSLSIHHSVILYFASHQCPTPYSNHREGF